MKESKKYNKGLFSFRNVFKGVFSYIVSKKKHRKIRKHNKGEKNREGSLKVYSIILKCFIFQISVFFIDFVSKTIYLVSV